jgi:hypothetical protein
LLKTLSLVRIMRSLSSFCFCLGGVFCSMAIIIILLLLLLLFRCCSGDTSVGYKRVCVYPTATLSQSIDTELDLHYHEFFYF